MDPRETGSAVTWKYPSCVLKGDNSIGEFYSIAVTNNFQQADIRNKNGSSKRIPDQPLFRKEYRQDPKIATAVV